MTMNTVRGCSYNPINNTLTLSESFVKKASRLGTASVLTTKPSSAI